MLTYPKIDPVAFHLGPLSVHWYGIMYLAAFASCWFVLSYRIRASERGFTVDQLSDIIFYAAVGIIVGGRLGYMIFYNWEHLIHKPWELFMVWQGGMSFHGGLIGCIVAIWLYGRHIGKTLLSIGDLVAPAVPIGLGLGRIGNFINGELWGRATTMPWGMVFPEADNLPRHPSQLYEFFLEGILLFLVLWIFSKKPKPSGAVSGLFLILYGLLRFIIEFFREPDSQVGYIAFGWLTEGQLLSLPMIIVGMLFLLWAYQRKNLCSNI